MLCIYALLQWYIRFKGRCLTYTQQSIFLVVIIESFADLRSVSDDQPSTKQQSPTVLQLGASEDQKVKLQKKQQSAEKFVANMDKYYVRVIEKVFILVVVVDAIITATKYTGMPGQLAKALEWWQVCYNYYVNQYT